jgi:hypothetical protein
VEVIIVKKVSLYEVIEYESLNEGSFWSSVEEFLDCANSYSNVDVYNAIIKEPTKYKNVDAWKYACAAAVAENIVNSRNIDVEEWCSWWNNDMYTLSEPITNSKLSAGLRLLFEFEAPYEFKKRNIRL